MKTAIDLETVRRVLHDDEGAIDEELDGMPQEKLRELYNAGVVEIVRCDSCGEQTWLIGLAGHNSTSSCHNCGETYKVVG